MTTASRPRSDAAPGADSGCGGVLQDDLGWALGVVFRSYAKAASAAFGDVPGGPRGYQVLAVSTRGEPGSQLELAHHLGVDRTVMTYLLDDLERAGLIERHPDPADRRARRGAASCSATSTRGCAPPRTGSWPGSAPTTPGRSSARCSASSRRR
jgi:hypothetical protein